MDRGRKVKNTWTDFQDFDRATCRIAAAIIGAGALGAGASIWGANKAAGAQTDATNKAIANSQQMFGVSKNALDPFINAGQGGIPGLQRFLDPSQPGPLANLTSFTDPNNQSGPLNALMKLLMPGAGQNEALRQTPGFQFTEDRGLKAVNNALAARGLGGSGGAVAKGASDFATGNAQSTWSSVVNALQNMFTSGSGALQNVFSSGSNALQNFIGTGAQAGGALAGNAANFSGQTNNALIGQGNAQAGAATATGQAIGGLGNSISTAAIIQKLTGGGGNSPASGPGGLYSTFMGPQNTPDNYSGMGSWA